MGVQKNKASREAVEEKYTVNAVNLSDSDWEILRRVSWARRRVKGSGRPSMSKVVHDLIQANRKALLAEIQNDSDL